MILYFRQGESEVRVELPDEVSAAVTLEAQGLGTEAMKLACLGAKPHSATQLLCDPTCQLTCLLVHQYNGNKTEPTSLVWSDYIG